MMVSWEHDKAVVSRCCTVVAVVGFVVRGLQGGAHVFFHDDSPKRSSLHLESFDTISLMVYGLLNVFLMADCSRR